MFNKLPEDPNKVNIGISLFTTFKVTGVVLLMILSLQFLSSILSVILLFLASIFIAVALNPIIKKIGELLHIKRRVLSITIAFALVFSSIALLLAVTIPPVFNQLGEFSGDLVKEFSSDSGGTDSEEQINDSGSEEIGRLTIEETTETLIIHVDVGDSADSGEQIDGVGVQNNGQEGVANPSAVSQQTTGGDPADSGEQSNWLSGIVERYNLDTYLVEFGEDVGQHFTEDVDNIFDVFQQVSSAFAAIIIILVMSFMLLLEGPAFTEQVEKFLPKEQAKRWHKLSREMSIVISGYISGQMLIAVIAGLAAMLFMSLLNVENALALAGIVTLCALIPLIGAILGAAIVVIMTLLTDVNAALILAVFFIIYQQVENATIQPWIQGQQTNLSILQVFLAALIGVQIAGVLGALLAVPVAACLKILILDYLKTHKDYLEKVYMQIAIQRRKKT